jgi:hypothetical protein
MPQALRAVAWKLENFVVRLSMRTVRHASYNMYLIHFLLHAYRVIELSSFVWSKKMTLVWRDRREMFAGAEVGSHSKHMCV